METRSTGPFSVQTPTEDNLTCPQCGEGAVTTTMCLHVFSVGSGEDASDLEVQLPARQCQSCDFGFLDSEAEEIKHNALCQHLGVLTPSDVRHIRESYSMSRSAFAKLTGFGEATLGRWENGIIIQNLANDRFLRLLGSPWIMRRLESLRAQTATSALIPKSNVVVFQKLKVSENILHEQASFHLRLVG